VHAVESVLWWFGGVWIYTFQLKDSEVNIIGSAESVY